MKYLFGSKYWIYLNKNVDIKFSI